MTDTIATDRSTTFNLATGDGFFVPMDVLAATTSTYAVFSPSGNHSNRIRVDGSVVSTGATAIRLDANGTYGGHSVTIGQTGIVTSLFGDAMQIYGANSTLRNFGQVAGETQGVWLIDFNNGLVENFGDMSGLSGAGVRLYQATHVTILNSGLISGNQGIEGYQSTFDLTNSGVIQAASASATIMADAAASGIRIDNSGVIRGRGDALSATDHADNVINSGSIVGNVELKAGDDTYRASDLGSVDGTIFGGAGDDILRGAAAEDLLVGGGGQDTLRGRHGDDSLSGNGGNDRLVGGAGEDLLLGGRGRDVLFGGNQDDILNGQAGNDWLNGGRGDDILTGAIGADVFAFNRNAGDDTITDFVDGDDRINLSAFGFAQGDFAVKIAPALSNAGGGATFLDLEILGGHGSVLIEGLGFAQADAGDFIL